MKKEREQQSNYQTLQIWIKKGHRMYVYFQESCQNAKNMYNTTNFYIRQVYTGLTQEKKLHSLQKEVLDTIDQYLKKMNATQVLAYQKKLAKEKTKPKEKQQEIKCNLFSKPTKEKPHVDYHFLDALFKAMLQKDYRSLPAQSSQSIMKTVFGQNKRWKQETDMGKKQNQTFCHIPHRVLIQMITYKAKAVGIQVIVTEESYTSKASFLDHDFIPTYGTSDQHATFSGKRIKRGMYRSAKGIFINADVNAAANILRKVFPNAWTNGIEGLGVKQLANVLTPLTFIVR
ncbi:IS200/IS605 family accessory protein TnpB-related protein [Microbacteriaceae bacterium 4G12]